MRVFLVLVTFLLLSSHAAFAEVAPYDLVILGGRVIDPETGLDETGLNVGVRAKSIETITRAPITGKKVINAAGLVVSPGFIDILSYDPNDYGVWFKLADGVTTNLSLHGGAVDMASWYKANAQRGLPLNYGAAFFYGAARLALGIGRYEAASEEKLKRLVSMAEKAMEEGALAIGISIEYAPGITVDEIDAMGRVAKRFNVPVFYHVRYSDMELPGTNIDALNEVIDSAKKTGASIHIDHISSTGGTFSMKESVRMIEEARRGGCDITACAYPYPYWATYLNSARFDNGWQERFRITYKDLQIGGTTERLSAASFKKYRKTGKLAVAYAIPEDDVEGALRAPFVMVGSDAIMEPDNNNHPRAAGAFTRTIAVYARRKKVISLMEAIGKMTILPAKRLEAAAPAFKKKGRLQAGADADIVVFDYDAVTDTATVDRPNRYAEGVEYVIVNGTVVKEGKTFHKGVRAGEGLRAGGRGE